MRVLLCPWPQIRCPTPLDSTEIWNALLWHFLCWHSPRYLETAGSSQRQCLAPVRPHPLPPHTSFCPAFLYFSFYHPPPSVPSNLLSPWPPEALSAPPVVHTIHEPPTGTAMEDSLSGHGSSYPTGLDRGHSSQCSMVTRYCALFFQSHLLCWSCNLILNCNSVPLESVNVTSNWLRSELLAYHTSGLGVCPFW